MLDISVPAGGWALGFVFDLRVPHPLVSKGAGFLLFSQSAQKRCGKSHSNSFAFKARIVFLTMEVDLWYTSVC